MDTKKLKSISAELKKASAMHKAQALKIDKILKSIKNKINDEDIKKSSYCDCGNCSSDSSSDSSSD